MSRPLTSEEAIRLQRAYEATHKRLRNEPEYRQLESDAIREATDGSTHFTARNRFRFYIEIHTPLDTPA